MANQHTFIDKNRHLTSFDLRAEVIFDAFISQNIDDLNINVKPNGIFYRRYSSDRMNISQDALNKEILNLEISRDGFYDVLPERIVHNYTDVNNSVKEFKNRKR